MKKHILNFTLVLVLVFALSHAVMGAEDDFNASLAVDKSVAGQIAVTVEHSTVLETYRPTLSIPCDSSYSNAMVLFDGVAEKAQYDNQTVTFTVAKGGTYYIVSEATLVQTVKPTCKEDGKNIYELNGDSYTEVLPSPGHDFSNKNSKTCANCSEANPNYQQTDIPFIPIITPTYPPVADNNEKEDTTEGSDENDNIEEKCSGGQGCVSTSFSDVDPTQWYHEAIDYVIENSLMNGIGDNLFDVNGTTTRAQIVTILWRLEKNPVVNYAMSFTDVAADAWYTEAIRWAASEGIVNGYSDTAFGPDDNITREQLAAILYRYEQHKGGGFKGLWMYRMNYTDIADISDWAYEAMAWCNMNGILTGKDDGILDPKGNAKRCEAAAMLMRYLEKQN